jgi:hypothetical protein
MADIKPPGGARDEVELIFHQQLKDYFDAEVN